jgi:hypothetical protein
MTKKSAEELRRIQELRRSNAATPIQNKKSYTRQSQAKMLYLLKQKGETE